MKTLSQISARTPNPRHDPPAHPAHGKLPLIDSAYHPTSENLRAASRSLQTAPSFRHLSDKFLNDEMKREYASEAVFFAVIVGLSGWSIVSLLHAVSGLMI